MRNPKIQRYELNFALLEQALKLNSEVDGDQHIDARGRQRRQDITCDRVLANLDRTVLRVPAWRSYRHLDLVIVEIRMTRDSCWIQSLTSSLSDSGRLFQKLLSGCDK